MRRGLWIVLALASAASIALVLFRAATGGDAGVESAPTSAAAREPSAPSTGQAPVVDVESLVERSAPSAERVSSAMLPDAEGLELRVVEQGTQKPVAGAVVRAIPMVRVKRVLAEHPGRTFDLEDPHPDVVELVTDAQGRVELPRSVTPGVCCARSGALFDQEELHEDETLRVLEIAPDHALAVQVVDASGRPVEGVPLTATLVTALLELPPEWTCPTRGADGIAILKNLDRLITSSTRSALVRVRPAIPARADTVPFVDVDLTALPGEPLRLVLPPCGSVDVILRGPRGEPAHSRGVRLMDVTEDPSVTRRHWVTFQPSVLEAGRAHFPFVGIGLSLLVPVGSHVVLGSHLDGPGPRHAGERVEFDVEFNDPRWRIVGRVLGPESEPYAWRSLQLWSESRVGRGAHPILTDGDGRFEEWLVFAERQLAGGVLRLASTRRDHELEARFEVSDPPPHGTIDVGEMVLAGPTILARGRVVDDVGAPLAKVGLRFSSSSVVRGSMEWKSDGRLHAVVHENGRFEVRGRRGEGPLRIHAWDAGCVRAAPVEFTPPCAELEIVLMRASTIDGRILLDPHVQANTIDLEIARSGVPFDPRDVVDVGVDPDGSFHATQILPGRVDLRVRRSGVREPLLVIEGLTLLPGEPARDDRLLSIDLTGRVPTPAPR